ncbi:hypothetical protein RvY_19041-1 [Ramazzottius varieornatus]|uniref:Uncharacterized protein n=1 Tax=Ramazzottius varieornatus TaxID=947166 RepID=A0A1D1W808_RAMVA|nr:hypothetical protein RvY_19041-1 [Ramazzottius varieornatus]
MTGFTDQPLGTRGKARRLIQCRNKAMAATIGLITRNSHQPIRWLRWYSVHELFGRCLYATASAMEEEVQMTHVLFACDSASIRHKQSSSNGYKYLMEKWTAWYIVRCTVHVTSVFKARS